MQELKNGCRVMRDRPRLHVGNAERPADLDESRFGAGGNGNDMRVIDARRGIDIEGRHVALLCEMQHEFRHAYGKRRANKNNQLCLCFRGGTNFTPSIILVPDVRFVEPGASAASPGAGS